MLLPLKPSLTSEVVSVSGVGRGETQEPLGHPDAAVFCTGGHRAKGWGAVFPWGLNNVVTRVDALGLVC